VRFVPEGPEDAEAPPSPWHIEIQEDEVGSRRVPVVAPAGEKREGLLAVGDHVRRIVDRSRPQRVLDHGCVAGVVLDDQDVESILPGFPHLCLST